MSGRRTKTERKKAKKGKEEKPQVFFEDTWADFGGAWDTCAYYKDAAGIVHIKGLMKDGTINVAAFTLPVGYRPRADIHFGVVSSNAIGRMEIHSDGEVYPILGNNAWFTVHCSFPAEQ